MFDDIFLVFNEYAYQFERDLRIIRQKQGYYCTEWFIYIHVFLKGLKIYHNFCVMLRLCALSLDKSFRPPEKKEGTDVKKLRNDVYRLQLKRESPDVREI